jgi:hypothetical protein
MQEQNLAEEKIQTTNNKIGKCPEYILRNQRKYYAKKSIDPEYMEKRRIANKEYREANRERINEMAKLRAREKRKAAKDAKIADGAKICVADAPITDVVASVAELKL